MSAIVPANSPDSLTPDQKVVARELGAAFGQMVGFYRDHYKLSPEEARKRAALTTPEFDEHVRNLSAEEVSWLDLDHISQSDPELALQGWESIKQAALEELRSGHRAAKMMETADSRCWDRARFLALRAELADEWQPRNGIERQLLDTVAQAQASYFIWLERHIERTTVEALHAVKPDGEARRWVAPRVRDVEAIEQAAEMVDRFNRIVLRTLRTLHDLRRYSQQVIVQHASQVNIGEKQVNVS